MTDFLIESGIAALTGLIAALCVSVASALFYPSLRKMVSRSALGFQSIFLMVLAAVPIGAFLGMTAASLWWTFRGGVISDHCHVPASSTACFPHAPVETHLLAPGVFVALGVALCALVALEFSGLAARSRQRKRVLHACSREDMRGRRILETDRPVALTAGLWRPEIYISQGLKRRLGTDELRVVMHHENAHAARYDSLSFAMAAALSRAHFPSVRRQLLADLHLSHERACDEAAAHRIGDRLCVAATILRIERMNAAGGETRHCQMGITGGSVPARVEALMGAAKARSPVDLTTSSLYALAIPIALALAAEPLHSAVEFVFSNLPG